MWPAQPQRIKALAHQAVTAHLPTVPGESFSVFDMRGNRLIFIVECKMVIVCTKVVSRERKTYSWLSLELVARGESDSQEEAGSIAIAKVKAMPRPPCPCDFVYSGYDLMTYVVGYK